MGVGAGIAIVQGAIGIIISIIGVWGGWLLAHPDKGTKQRKPLGWVMMVGGGLFAYYAITSLVNLIGYPGYTSSYRFILMCSLVILSVGCILAIVGGWWLAHPREETQSTHRPPDEPGRRRAMKLTKLAGLLLLIAVGIGLVIGAQLLDKAEEVVPDINRWPPTTDTPASHFQNLTARIQVHFIDVGQGDAILIDCGEREVLIDGGNRSPGIINYLEDYVNGSIELLVATHPHADHIGGLVEVLETYDVNQIWLNGDTATSNTYNDFIGLVEAWTPPTDTDWPSGEPQEVRRGTVMKWPIACAEGEVHYGPSSYVDSPECTWLEIYVLHPVDPLSDDINNNSIVLQATLSRFDLLFMGDAEVEAEQSMIDADVLSDIEVLKVGHHGSHSSSSQEFLDIVKPEVAIYMAGEGNRYGHPHEETLTALDNIGARIFGTDVNGIIVFHIGATPSGNYFYSVRVEEGSQRGIDVSSTNIP